MRKTNWVATIIIVIASVFLLWLWFFLGFDHVDSPLDLVLSIVWWVLVIAACIAIWRAEEARRERNRMAFVGQGVIYNPEAGLVNITRAPSPVVAIQSILENLEYGFDMKQAPDADALPMRYVVRTSKFQAPDERERQRRGDSAEPVWEGSVSFAERPDAEPVAFRNRMELAQILGC